jgi:dipeptidyl aminopeptidase/acylaminoacyl peptidase
MHGSRRIAETRLHTAAVARGAIVALTLFVGGLSPPLRAQTAPGVTAEDLATLTDLEAMSISPDGRLAAFVARRGDPSANSYVQRWMLVSIATGEVRELADAGDPILPNLYGYINGHIVHPKPLWSPDGAALFYRKDHNGRSELWRTSIADRATQQVADFNGEIQRIDVSTDGASLVVNVGPDPERAQAELQREGLSGFLFDERFSLPISTRPLVPRDFGVDARTMARKSSTHDAQERNFSVDLRTLRYQEIPAEQASAASTPTPANEREPRATDDKGRRAWFEARNPAMQGTYPPVTLVAALTPSSKPVVCGAPECTGVRFSTALWRKDEVLFIRSESILPGPQTLYAWNVRSGAVRRIFVAETRALAPSCTLSGRDLVCFHEELRKPTRLVAIDVERGTLRTLYDPNESVARRAGGYTVTQIDALASPSVTIRGFLVRRDDLAGQRLPLAMVTYRCSGFLRGGVGDEYPILPLAGQGVAVLCVDAPMDGNLLATLVPGELNSALRKNDSEKRLVQAGLDALVRKLLERGDIDGRRVALTGLSFGAETTNYALFNMPALTVAIASSAAMVPSDVFMTQAGGGWRAWEKWGLGDPYSERWRSLSVVYNTDRITAPLLLNVADHEVIGGSAETFSALDRAGRSVEMYVHPDEYHIKWQPAHRLAIYHRNIDWLNFWLRGVESNLSGNAAQYERWRTMRGNQCRLFGEGGAQPSANGSPWYCESAQR